MVLCLFHFRPQYNRLGTLPEWLGRKSSTIFCLPLKCSKPNMKSETEPREKVGIDPSRLNTTKKGRSIQNTASSVEKCLSKSRAQCEAVPRTSPVLRELAGNLTFTWVPARLPMYRVFKSNPFGSVCFCGVPVSRFK